MISVPGGKGLPRLGDWQEINYLDHARGDTNPTRQRGDRRRHALASASVPRWRVGLVWPVFSVPVSMRSLETDRSLGDFRAAGRPKVVQAISLGPVIGVLLQVAEPTVFVLPVHISHG